jgi:hypothetical protein
MTRILTNFICPKNYPGTGQDVSRFYCGIKSYLVEHTQGWQRGFRIESYWKNIYKYHTCIQTSCFLSIYRCMMMLEPWKDALGRAKSKGPNMWEFLDTSWWATPIRYLVSLPIWIHMEICLLTIDVNFYQVRLLMSCNVQTTNLTFVGEVWNALYMCVYVCVSRRRWISIYILFLFLFLFLSFLLREFVCG